jgi:hypothetical protein
MRAPLSDRIEVVQDERTVCGEEDDDQGYEPYGTQDEGHENYDRQRVIEPAKPSGRAEEKLPTSRAPVREVQRDGGDH